MAGEIAEDDEAEDDSHIFNVFRNAPISLLIICESYPCLFVSLSLFYICAYSVCIFSLLWPHFGFDMLFVLSALLFALREAFKLQPVKREESRTH